VGNFVLEAADTRGQEFSMRKNLRFGWVSCGAIQSCILARKGFTGQVRVIEGEMGVNEVLYGNKMDLERLLDFRGWRILNTRHKYVCGGAAEQAHAGCTLAIVTENNLKPEDIAAVTIYVRPSADLLRPALPFNYPRNAETADHSAIYTTAIAITERALGPFSYEPQKFSDPVVLDLIEKITAKPDPAMGEITKGFYTSSGFQGKSEIVTKDGRRFQKHIVNPHGFGDDPLTDKELEDKFSEMALKYMDKGQVQKIFDTIWNADKLDDVNNLMRLMVFKSSASAKRGG
jgi:2-methylcitrate dehydratase